MQLYIAVSKGYSITSCVVVSVFNYGFVNMSVSMLTITLQLPKAWKRQEWLPYLQVSFVPYKHDDYIRPSLCSHIFYPLVNLLEGVGIYEREWREGGERGPGREEGREGGREGREGGLLKEPLTAARSLTCDVIDNHGNRGVTDIGWDETAESLLPCCVPQLQPDLGLHHYNAHTPHRITSYNVHTLHRITSLYVHTLHRITSLYVHTLHRITSYNVHTLHRITSYNVHTLHRITSLYVHTLHRITSYNVHTLHRITSLYVHTLHRITKLLYSATSLPHSHVQLHYRLHHMLYIDTS